MTVSRYILPVLAAMLMATSAPAQSVDKITVAGFEQEDLSEWKVKEFEGQTDYRLVEMDGRTVLQAQAQGTASGLVREIDFDPKEYRYLSWSWKIRHTVAGGDARTKEGDDYAARIYVVFPGRFFWQTRALNYIWANRLPQGEFVPNAFTSNALMLAVRSGDEQAGQWLSEQRDIVADFRRLFGEDPPQAGAIAIMTDTDNTGTEAIAWYGDITLSTSP